ncbi:MAG: DUF512 domain-containing protein [Oscillospiraceae bacterium]
MENEFFGPMITVTGLVVGQDILRALGGRELGEELIIPAQMLRYDRDRFLDDVLRCGSGAPGALNTPGSSSITGAGWRRNSSFM